MISLITAVAKNRVIGHQSHLPWDIPEEWRYFKTMTVGKPIIMGRKTWQSLKGAPLPDRANIVITRDSDFQADGGVVTDSLEAAIAKAKETEPEEIMVIGGGEIYAQALPLADRLYITEIDLEVEGDTFFPEYSQEEWEEVRRTKHVSPDGIAYACLVKEKRPAREEQGVSNSVSE